MKNLFLFVFLVSMLNVNAQKRIIEKSSVTFFSDATVEDIKGLNKKTSGIWVSESNAIAFSVPIIEFKFDKKLMQEHFNEKYMETEKFPKATFEGVVMNFKADVKGSQDVSAKGKLTIHGVTKEVEIPGKAEVSSENKISIKSVFIVKLEDYKIAIPQLLFQNIAEQVEVTIEFTFK